jgi:hypothetical protein
MKVLRVNNYFNIYMWYRYINRADYDPIRIWRYIDDN